MDSCMLRLVAETCPCHCRNCNENKFLLRTISPCSGHYPHILTWLDKETRLVPTGWETCDQPALCDQIIILTTLFLPVEYLQKVKGLWKKPCWQLVYLTNLVCTSWLVVKCPLTPQELFFILTVTVFTFFLDFTERAIYIIHDFKCITLQKLNPFRNKVCKNTQYFCTA